MAKKLKRAFTIVELVIVIAVIAILAAVLIPTFTTLIDKANQSADTSNVKNMNSILAMDETTNGKPKTMYDAVKVIREGGYDLEKLTPTGQGYDIVWDQDANRLLMVNGEEVIFGETEKNANGKHLWVVVDSQDEIETTKYSVYLTDAFAGEVTAAQGVDVGANEDVTKVTYNTAEKQDVTIRTDGGALVVDAERATVSHYDTAASVDIQAVADHSYYEYGTVAGNITLKQGRFVAEDKSSAVALIVTAENKEDINIVINGGQKPWSIGATILGSEISSVISGNGEKEVVEGTAINDDTFAGGLGTENSPYLISNEEQFLNIKNYEEEMKTKSYFFKMTNHIDLSKSEVGSSVSKTFNGILDGSNFTLKVKDSMSYLFNFAVNDVCIKNLTYSLDESNVVIMFNRYGTTATNYSNGIYEASVDQVNLAIENVSIIGEKGKYYKFNDLNRGIITHCQSYLEILNAREIGGQPDSNGESYYGFTSDTSNCNTNTVIRNCNVSVNLSGSAGYNAVFLGGQIGPGNDVLIENCDYSGVFVGEQVGMIFSNWNWCYDENQFMSEITVNDVSVSGQIISRKNDGGVSFANNKYEFDGVSGKENIIKLGEDAQFSVTVDDTNKYVIKPALDENVSYYTLSFYLGELAFANSDYSINFGVSSNFNISIALDDFNVEFYKVKRMTLKQAKDQGIDITDLEWKQSLDGFTYAFAEDYLIIDFETSGQYRYFTNTEVSVKATVYAYGVDGRLLYIAEEQ